MLEEQNQVGIIFSCGASVSVTSCGSRLIWYTTTTTQIHKIAANADESRGNGGAWPVATVFPVETESAEQRVPHTKKGPQIRIKMSEHKSEKKKINAFLLAGGARLVLLWRPSLLAWGNLFTNSALEAESNENDQRATEMERGLAGKK